MIPAFGTPGQRGPVALDGTIQPPNASRPGLPSADAHLRALAASLSTTFGGHAVPVPGGVASTPVGPQQPGTTVPIAGGAASTPMPTQDGILRPIAGAPSQPPGTTVRIPGGMASTPSAPVPPGTTTPIAGGAASTPVASPSGILGPLAGGETQPAGISF